MAAYTRSSENRTRLVADDEALPFANASFDLVFAGFGLHWVNDLPGTLVQIGRALAPDGVLIACLPGGATLSELRAVLTEAELEEQGGVSPHISPFVDTRDAAGLLQRAGFAMPVADSDRITVTYADPLALLRDLQRTGESNALMDRRRAPLRRATLARAMALYRERYPAPGNRVAATFEIVTLTGWAPHADQPKPLRPGSARHRLAESLGAEETSAGEATPRQSRDE
jgi:SAM-dependent methyltransferase